MSFDPAQNAASLAALVARADGGQFFYASNPTQAFAGNHPQQCVLAPVRLRKFRQTVRLACTWAAVYRGRRLAGEVLVVDAQNAAIGEAFTLARANVLFDLVDLQCMRDGANPNVYAPA